MDVEDHTDEGKREERIGTVVAWVGNLLVLALITIGPWPAVGFGDGFQASVPRWFNCICFLFFVIPTPKIVGFAGLWVDTERLVYQASAVTILCVLALPVIESCLRKRRHPASHDKP